MSLCVQGTTTPSEGEPLTMKTNNKDCLRPQAHLLSDEPGIEPDLWDAFILQ